MTKRLACVFFTSVLCSLFLFSQEYKAEKLTLENCKLDNLYRVDKGIYRSEQPGESDFPALEKYGIKEVLNLRGFHSDDDEAKGTNLTLHRIKIHASTIDENELAEALRIIYNRKGNILIHCRHGSDRTGAVIAMYRIIFQHIPKEEAINEMREGGFGFHKIYFNIAKTIRNIDVDKMRTKVIGLAKTASQ